MCAEGGAHLPIVHALRLPESTNKMKCEGCVPPLLSGPLAASDLEVHGRKKEERKRKKKERRKKEERKKEERKKKERRKKEEKKKKEKRIMVATTSALVCTTCVRAHTHTNLTYF